MTRKSLLNVTSRKKRNGMLSWSNTTATGASQTTQVGSAFVSGANAGSSVGLFLFSPTAMDLTSPTSHIIAQDAGRTSRVCWMKGFSEHLRIQTSSPLPWFHRRICFTSKGPSPFSNNVTSDTPTQPYAPYIETSNGLERLWFNQVVNSMGNTSAAQLSLLFKGEVNKDWNDYILAPIDTSRVTLRYDKTWTIKSGNNTGNIVERKLYHPMNKTLVYDDDESGVAESSSHYSVDSRAGMGDYYIMDIIQPGIGATSTDLINIVANSTMYWHER